MGMFDWVRSEVPLPDGFDGPMQTKDLDCTLETYTITRDGRLVNEGDTQFHGTLRFYGIGRAGEWHEYNAIFAFGQLQEIVWKKLGD